MTKNAEAAGKFKLALDRFIGKYPLHGGIVAAADIRTTPDGTCAVGLVNERLVLYYCESFVLAITVEELVGVIHHETLHVVYRHVFMEPSEYPDQMALTIAQEVTVNEAIGEKLPGRPMLLEDFKDLPENEDTVTRYGRLEKAMGNTLIVTLDDHGTWGQIRDDEEAARLLVENGLRRGIERLKDPTIDDAEELRTIAVLWDLDPNDLTADTSWGSMPGGAVEEVTPTGDEATVNWRAQLRRYVGRALHKTPTYSRPPRRFPHLLGIVPGIIRKPAKAKVIAAIDTSGSMTADVLAKVSTELTYLARKREVLVVECDTEIQRSYKYAGPIREVHGRGGTDLCPPLERSFLRQHRADVVVYLTDGYGDVPDEPPEVPVIWALTPYGEPPAPWGHVVRIEE